MSISNDEFDSQSEFQYQYKYENQTLIITELTKMFLIDIQPSQNEWPEVENATTVLINNNNNNQETTNETF